MPGTVAQQFGTDHHEILVQPDVAALLPKLVWHLDEPIADAAFFTTFLVSEFARRDVTVILSGVGGDELFGGYTRYLDQHYRRVYQRVPKVVRRVILDPIARVLPSDRHSNVLNKLRLAKAFILADALGFQERYARFMEVFSATDRRKLLRNPNVVIDDCIARAFQGTPVGDSLRQLMQVDLETQLAEDLLMLTDKMSMATSLECRVPLLDQRLVELAARMPEQVKMRGGALKHVMKSRDEGRSAGQHPPREPNAALGRRSARGSRTSSRDWCERCCRLRPSNAAAWSIPQRFKPSSPSTQGSAKTAPTTCWRSSTWKFGADCISTVTAPKVSPTSYGYDSRHEDSLRLSPRSLSTEARRQNPPVQHHPPSLERRTRGRGRFVGAQLGRARGCRGAAATLRPQHRGNRARPGSLGAACSRGADSDTLELRLLSLTPAETKNSSGASLAAVRLDLRPLLFGCAVCRGRRGRGRKSWISATWTHRSGANTRYIAPGRGRSSIVSRP